VEERVGDPDGREGVRGVVHAARRDVGQDEGPETGAGAGAGHPCPAAVETDAGRGLLGGGRGEVLGGAGGGGRGMGCARGEKERRGHGVLVWGRTAADRSEARWDISGLCGFLLSRFIQSGSGEEGRNVTRLCSLYCRSNGNDKTHTVCSQQVLLF
jgi:hypothetical protein